VHIADELALPWQMPSSSYAALNTSRQPLQQRCASRDAEHARYGEPPTPPHEYAADTLVVFARRGCNVLGAIVFQISDALAYAEIVDLLVPEDHGML
jgi:hypothetical protein